MCDIVYSNVMIVKYVFQVNQMTVSIGVQYSSLPALLAGPVLYGSVLQMCLYIVLFVI